MKTWSKRFMLWMNKDVVNLNESKKTAVMTRWICAVMMLFATGQLVFILFLEHPAFAVLPAGIFCVCGITWYLTYSSHTAAAFYFAILMIPGWILISTILYGWSAGAQYGFGILAVYLFQSSRLTPREKLLHITVLMAECAAIFTLGLYFRPLFQLSRPQIAFQEFINMFAAFSTIAMITTVFTRDTLDAERKLMNYNKEMMHQAETDALTGLMNRRAGEKFFEEICVRALRENIFVNVVMGDIDYFKKVNDTYGHDAGDEVLKTLSAIFRDFMKDKGAVARWGGEEFLFFIVGMNGDDACLELEKLRDRIENTYIQAGNQKLHVTMTFGIEECGKDQSMEEALEAADRKLYMGKARGRNQVMM